MRQLDRCGRLAARLGALLDRRRVVARLGAPAVARLREQLEELGTVLGEARRMIRTGEVP
jgi:hypothetical protein